MDDHRRQMLNEQYEEAALALLMDEWAESDGSRLWAAFEEARSQGNTPDMPDALDRQCKSLAEHTFRKRVRSAKWKSACKKALKAAVITLALLAVTSKIFLSVDAIRIPVLNTFFAISDRLNFLEFSDGLQRSGPDIGDTLAAFIPEGYELETDYFGEDSSRVVCYVKDDDHRIMLEMLFTSSTSIVLDTENTIYSKSTINGYPVLLLEKTDRQEIRILWIVEEQEKMYILEAHGLDISELQSLASALITECT